MEFQNHMKLQFSVYENISYGLLFSFLNKIYLNAKENQMTSENLSICFLPLLIQQKETNFSSANFMENFENGKLLLIYFIEHYEDIFDAKMVQEHYVEFGQMDMDIWKLTRRASELRQPRISLYSENDSLPRKNTIMSSFLKKVVPVSESESEIESAPTARDLSPRNNFITTKFDPSTETYLTVWYPDLFIWGLSPSEVFNFFLISSSNNYSME
jgi:hypothetical protein